MVRDAGRLVVTSNRDLEYGRKGAERADHRGASARSYITYLFSTYVAQRTTPSRADRRADPRAPASGSCSGALQTPIRSDSMSDRRVRTLSFLPALQLHMAVPHTSGAITRLAKRAEMARAEPGSAAHTMAGTNTWAR